MSWLFSQALVEEFWEATCSDGAQSAPLSGNPTQQAYLPPDRMTKFSRISRFGMTFKPLTENLGEELLKLYLAGFHVRTFPAQGGAQELTESAAECGRTWLVSLAKYDHDLSLWKTPQCSLLEDWIEFSETWPRWGTMQNGVCWELPMSERHISAIESGSEQKWATPTTMDKLPPKSEQALMREATVTRPNRSKPANLRDQVSNMQNWPTPRSCSAMAATITPENSWNQDRFPNLETVVGRRMWPTPQASDNRDRGNLGSGAIQRRKEKGKQISLGQSVSDISRALNPQWVEWLMGWPIDFTDLKPLETARFQAWLQQHGEF